MKNNRLLLFVGILSTFLTSYAYSLGLGDISSDSALNEPLIAEIDLINVGDLENNEVLVSIGSNAEYNLAGVQREFFHSTLQFEVQIEGTNNPRIIVRSQEPLTDPYLNFLVQIRWPQGKLLREYTLLLDLPVFSAQPASQPAATPDNNTARTAREAVAQQDSQQNQQPEQSSKPSSFSIAPRPRIDSQGSDISSGKVYQVKRGETLWGIADRVASSNGTSLHQAMIALHEENLDSFVNGDINRLKANTQLRIPSSAQMDSRTEGQAARDFTSLTRNATAAPIESSQTNFRDDINREAPAQGGRLALSNAGDSDASNGSTDNGVGSDQDSLAETVAETLSENASLKEQLDAAAIENQELEARIANLQDQVDLLEEERELQLESEALAAVQEAVEEPEPVEEPEVAETPAPKPQVTTKPDTFWDKFKYWIIGGFGLLVVIGLMVAFLVIRGRNSSEVEELYYDDDELDEELDVEEPSAAAVADEPAGSAELDESDESDESLDDIDLFGEITDDLDDSADLDSGLDDLEDDIEDSADDIEEEILDIGDLSDTEESETISAFDDVDDQTELPSDGEFDDLDEFFASESSDATDVLFGEGDALDDASMASDDDAELAEQDSSDSESMLEFSAPDEFLDDDSLSEDSSVDEGAPEQQRDDEDALEFDIGDVNLGDGESEPQEVDTTDLDEESVDIDLEDGFGYTEEGITDDLAPEAEAEFEKSIEIHSSEMDELLVPSDALDGLEELAESQKAADDALEELPDDLETLDDADSETDDSDQDSFLDIEQELDLDEDMEADLDDLDLGGEDFEIGDEEEEFITKLELAEAYIEMGDVQGAQELLKEVEEGGSEEQKATAQSFLEQITRKK